MSFGVNIFASHTPACAGRPAPEVKTRRLPVNTQSSVKRRHILAGIALAPLFAQSEANALQLPTKETDDATSEYIQNLLKITESKREERVKERLNDYYRRNFKDYFGFNMDTAKQQGLSKETAEAIKAWMETNR